MATGLVLLVVEIFVTPGFGAAGLLGIGALLGGLGLSVVGTGATWDVILRAGGRVAASLLLALVGAVVMLRALPRLPFGRRLVLQQELTAQAGYASAPESDRQWVGKRGTTVSPLRPAGIAEFVARELPFGRFGRAEEVGAAVAFLVSPRASWISGASVPVDGCQSRSLI